MLDITVYPECLDCPCPDFKDAGSTTVVIPFDDEFINQRLACSHERVCKRIKDQRIDFTPYVEEARDRMGE